MTEKNLWMLKRKKPGRINSDNLGAGQTESQVVNLVDIFLNHIGT